MAKIDLTSPIAPYKSLIINMNRIKKMHLFICKIYKKKIGGGLNNHGKIFVRKYLDFSENMKIWACPWGKI